MRRTTMTTRMIGAALATVLAGAAMTACSSPAEPTPDPGTDPTSDAIDEIVVARSGGGGFQAVIVADEEGIFEKHGIKATIDIGAAEASKAIPLVVSGDYDFAMSSAPDVLRAQASGIPVQMIAGVQNAASLAEGVPTDGVVVAPDSPITTWADLEGKTIGIGGLGNLPQIVNNIALVENGVDVDSVTYVALPNDALIDAALGGQVDAILPVALFHNLAIEQGFTPLGGGASEFFPGASQITWIASDQLIAENPDLVERFVAAMTEATAFANANHDVIRDIHSRLTQLPPDFIATRTINPLSTDLSRERLEELMEHMHTFGFLDEKLDLSGLVWSEAPGA